MVGGQGKEESSAADAPHLHYDLATATAEHEHGSDESRSAGHRRSSDGREQGRVIGRAHGPLGKTLACHLKVACSCYLGYVHCGKMDSCPYISGIILREFGGANED